MNVIDIYDNGSSDCRLSRAVPAVIRRFPCHQCQLQSPIIQSSIVVDNHIHFDDGRLLGSKLYEINL